MTVTTFDTRSVTVIAEYALSRQQWANRSQNNQEFIRALIGTVAYDYALANEIRLQVALAADAPTEPNIQIIGWGRDKKLFWLKLLANTSIDTIKV